MIITNFNKLGFSGSVDIITEYVPPSQTEFTTPGTYTWIAPRNVNNVCAVCVGGGGGGSVSYQYSGTFEAGGGGGGLGWKNNIRVLPGQTYTVVVGNGGRGGFFAPTGNYNGAGGDSSWFIDSGLVLGGGGGGGYVGEGGGNGGSGGSGNYMPGAGGAGGYSGNGGNGGNGFFSPIPNGNGSAGTGGGGGGGSCGGYGSLIGGPGGGVGTQGQGSNGGGGTAAASGSFRAGAGSGGSSGGNGSPFGQSQFSGFTYTSANYPETTFQMGGYHGGGGASGTGAYANAGRGGPGAVRIMWAGTGNITRVFPATNAGTL